MGGWKRLWRGIPRKSVAGAKVLRSEHDAGRARCKEKDEKYAAFEVWGQGHSALFLQDPESPRPLFWKTDREATLFLLSSGKQD